MAEEQALEEEQTGADAPEGGVNEGENEEVVIIEEGSDETATETTEQPQEEVVDESGGKKKKLLIIGGAVLVVLIAAGVGGFLIYKKKHHEAAPVEHKEKKEAQEEPRDTTELEEMIRKATALYSEGEKEKALEIFEQVAQYSESVSQYNLGVAKMKEENFQAALGHFEKALANKEHQCPSALNGAICALKLCDQGKFYNYLKVAKDHLPEEIDSPLYSTYYTLIHYYQTSYFEAMASLKRPTSPYMPEQSNNIKGRISYLFGDIDQTIAILKKEKSPVNELPIGLLYAQKDMYDEAINHLDKASKLNQDANLTLSALALVNLKAGYYANGAKALTEFQRLSKEPQPFTYPIRVTLKPSLFNIDAAQKVFKNDLFRDNRSQYSLLFYFAPYKVFDANQAITDIRKGQVGIMKEETDLAAGYLAKSSLTSKSNSDILKAIRLALSQRLHEAKKVLEKAVTLTPRHAVAQYNLGLVDAQLGNYEMAYKHFIRAYNLDTKNMEAGIFAIMTGKLIGNDPGRTINMIKSDLFAKTNSSTTYAQTVALLYFAEGNYAATTSWIEKGTQATPLGEVLRVLACNPDTEELKSGVNGAKKLAELLPDDMMASFVSLYYQHYREPVKQVASLGQNLFNRKVLDWRSLYYGSPFVKETMINFAFVTGMLPRVEEKLTSQLSLEKEDKVAIALTLARTEIYLKHFSRADAIYRQLIQNKLVNDTENYFLAAVATLGNGNSSDAIGFLNLAKMIDPKQSETRYALALLYLEAGNTAVAIKSLQNIENSSFKSKYFDFMLAQ
jgi:tetratricopeptide (TPR) repeat protein